MKINDKKIVLMMNKKIPLIPIKSIKDIFSLFLF